MTVNKTNDPNWGRLAEAWVRILASRSGVKSGEVVIERRRDCEGKD